MVLVSILKIFWLSSTQLQGNRSKRYNFPSNFLCRRLKLHTSGVFIRERATPRMTEVILAIHLMIAAALVAVVLLQRSEGGGLGIGGGGSGGMGGFMSARGTANLLTRATAILAACFFVTSLSLAIIADSGRPKSLADEIKKEETSNIPKAPQVPMSK